MTDDFPGFAAARHDRIARHLLRNAHRDAAAPPATWRYGPFKKFYRLMGDIGITRGHFKTLQQSCQIRDIEVPDPDYAA
jgi:hypothetical protein